MLVEMVNCTSVLKFLKILKTLLTAEFACDFGVSSDLSRNYFKVIYITTFVVLKAFTAKPVQKT